jgi:hypothetical protein
LVKEQFYKNNYFAVEKLIIFGIQLAARRGRVRCSSEVDKINIYASLQPQQYPPPMPGRCGQVCGCESGQEGIRLKNMYKLTN